MISRGGGVAFRSVEGEPHHSHCMVGTEPGSGRGRVAWSSGKGSPERFLFDAAVGRPVQSLGAQALVSGRVTLSWRRV